MASDTPSFPHYVTQCDVERNNCSLEQVSLGLRVREGVATPDYSGTGDAIRQVVIATCLAECLKAG